MKQELRHDYEIVVMELQLADTFAYQTTLLAFVNCLILVEQNPRRRTCVRNELIGAYNIILLLLYIIVLLDNGHCHAWRVGEYF